jgi:hypothetical protein
VSAKLIELLTNKVQSTKYKVQSYKVQRLPDYADPHLVQPKKSASAQEIVILSKYPEAAGRSEAYDANIQTS